ncbi:MAG: multicopper oxidase family protein [Gaiellaceae bacterium]
MLVRVLIGIVSVVALAAAAWVGKAWYDSRLPESYGAMEFGEVDYGGGPPQSHAQHPHVQVDALKGAKGTPDVRFRLVAKQAKVTLQSGKTLDAWTFNGQVPGPELRVSQGDLVEATLVNEDVDDGVTVHWHGVDVPNAEDGVAGVTQNVVMPGERYVYRFRVDQVGTFWYHSHQVSSKQVRRGLYGAFVIEPKTKPDPRELDLAVLAHDFSGATALGSHDGVQTRPTAPGTPVRLRLVNTNSSPERFDLSGTPFRVIAIDGTDLNGPTLIEGRRLVLGAGGRYDVAFTMPEYTVRLGVDASPTALVLQADPEDPQVRPGAPLGEDFEPAVYGTPKQTLLGSTTDFDRTFELDIGKRIGFMKGRPGYHWSVNSELFPETPMYMVSRGDLVKMRIVNDTDVVHPMHLHGHHLLVLSRDGKPATGSPWWVDTLNVLGNEEYEVAFRADNPGIWMDHCHNLPHARDGLTMHLAYEGVTTPFRLGDDPGNHPE